MGDFDNAEQDYNRVLQLDTKHADALQNLGLITQLKANIEEAENDFENNNFAQCVERLNPTIESVPWSASLRQLRADCNERQGRYQDAVSDLRFNTKLIPDHTDGHLRASELLYHYGEHEESLNEIRECLKLDQDHKVCHDHYTKVKKLTKQIQSAQTAKEQQSWEECISIAQKMQRTEPYVWVYLIRSHSLICHCTSKAGQLQQALQSCGKVLEMDPNNADAMCDRAEAYLLDQRYDEAIAEFQRASELGSQRAKEGIQKAQKLLKQSQKRDYYKILNVPRNARKKDILKAYRKLAQQWHPDKYSGADREEAEKKFIDIAAAKEVLTDPDKRQKYDSGEDPLDPEQQGHGHDPFGFHGFNPFGQGFQFKFHFN